MKLVPIKYEVKTETETYLVEATGNEKWALRVNGMCFDFHIGQFVWEPSPSNRDDAFISRCRVEDPRSALAVLEEWYSKENFR